MEKRRSEGTPAIRALDAAGIDYALHAYALREDGDTYGESVATALNVDPARLFKTLLAEVDARPVVAIVPVSTRLSVKALARAAGGKKAALLSPTRAERLTGYVPGGISPFGQKRRLPVFVDASLGMFDTVFVSAGRRGLQMELRPADLVQVLDARAHELAST